MPSWRGQGLLHVLNVFMLIGLGNVMSGRRDGH